MSVWSARLDLTFARAPGPGGVPGTRCTGVRHEGPLRIQKTLHPEGPDVCHAVILHPPAGVAGGDHLDTKIHPEEGAHAVVTTPGATRWYRSTGAMAHQQLDVRVASGATLEWLPQENLLFADARVTLESTVRLAPGARLLGWEVQMLGRRARGEHWSQPGQGLLIQRTAVHQGEALLWTEAGQVQAADPVLTSAHGWSGLPVAGQFMAVAPAASAHLAEALARDLPWHETLRAGVSLLEPGPLLLVRALAAEAQVLRDLFIGIRRRWREPLLGLPPHDLRLWAT